MRAADFLPFLAGAPLVAARAAWAPPQYGGYTLRWLDDFQGAQGSLPNENNWNIAQGNPNKNGELEVYTRSNQNLQLSGGQTVQLVPKRNGDGWTSASIESKYVFAPDAGRVTIAEALIRFGPGDPGRKRGIWPAFWLLGDSLRHGGSWPACGEVDILESKRLFLPLIIFGGETFEIEKREIRWLTQTPSDSGQRRSAGLRNRALRCSPRWHLQRVPGYRQPHRHGRPAHLEDLASHVGSPAW